MTEPHIDRDKRPTSRGICVYMVVVTKTRDRTYAERRSVPPTKIYPGQGRQSERHGVGSGAEFIKVHVREQLEGSVRGRSVLLLPAMQGDVSIKSAGPGC